MNIRFKILYISLIVMSSCAPHVTTIQKQPVESKQAILDTAVPPVSEASPPPSEISIVPINKVDKPPRLISGVPPSYSFEMVQHKVEGVVKALILVGRSGGVRDVSILEHLGHGTDTATREALMQYQFEPAVKDGAPVNVWIEMSVNFHPARK